MAKDYYIRTKDAWPSFSESFQLEADEIPTSDEEMLDLILEHRSGLTGIKTTAYRKGPRTYCLMRISIGRDTLLYSLTT